MDDLDDLFNNQALELRRGTIVLATLSTLHTPHYGYGLLQKLEDAGIAVDAGTLYPLLRRLEKQGVLDSTWDTSESRPRKFYALSTKGRELQRRLATEWQHTSIKLKDILKEN
jgi:PadR family transcriptional regulator PadR